MVFQASSSLDKNSWITPPEIDDPEGIPKPLGWSILVRPYPVTLNRQKTSLIMPDSDIEYMSYLTNIGRVVAIGPCCWTRPEHRDKDGNIFQWVQVGDFVSFAKNSGSRRTYKDVSFVLLVDDEINELLVDPQVFDDGFYKVDIPEDHYEKYNIKKT